MSTAQARADWNCDLLMRGVQNLNLVTSTIKFGSISREVIAGQATPRWDDFDKLRQIVEALLVEEKASLDAGKPEDFAREIGVIVENLKREYSHSFDYRETMAGSQEYHAGDYELRKVFRHELIHFNQIVPENFRLLLPALPMLTLEPLPLNQQAEDLVSRRKKHIVNSLKYFDPAFTSLRTYRSDYLNRFATHTELAPLQDLQKKLSHLSNVRLSMRRPESSRFWLPRAGFQNQRTTGSSRGTYRPELRNMAEANLLGMTPDEFGKLPADILPKYGYIRLAEKSSLSLNAIAADGYGTDIYDFKPGSLKDRSTYTIGDSLSYGYLWPFSYRTLGTYFTPLSYLKDAAPFLKLSTLGASDRADLQNPYFQLPINLYYLELQIFGTLSLDDVEQFTFTNAEPTGEFLDELLARGIRIKDGRANPDKPSDYVPTQAARAGYIPLLKRSPDGPLSE